MDGVAAVPGQPDGLPADVGQFGRLRRLVVTNQPPSEGGLQTVHLELASETAGSKVLALSFEDVRDLWLGDVGVGTWCHLQIADIADAQWEGLLLAVRDVEDEVIRFYCRSLSVRSDSG